MTVAEAIIGFKIKLDKSDTSAYPEFNTNVIKFWLDEATITFIKTRYSGNNPLQKAFEQGEKRLSDLGSIVVTQNIVPTVGTLYPNSYVFLESALTLKFWLFIKCQVFSSNTCINTPILKKVQQDDIYALLQDPFNKPTERKVLLLNETNTFYVFTTSTTPITNVRFTYIREPKSILKGEILDNQQLELSSLVHNEIVNLAVNLALENIESPRLQTQTLIKNQEE